MRYCRARYYHPTLQRFVSEDPIGFAGGFNLYNYVDNSPPNRVDPLGYAQRGQQNISVTHGGQELNKRTPIQQVEKALEEAIERGMSKAHIAKLRGLLKVISRAGIVIFIIGELATPAEAGLGSECPQGPGTCRNLPPPLSGRKDYGTGADVGGVGAVPILIRLSRLLAIPTVHLDCHKSAESER